METVAPIEDLAQVATRWQDTMLSLEKEYEQEPEVLKIGEVAIGTLGNFSASIGKAKSKKTFNVSAMVAAALSGKEVLNYTTDFPEGKNRILYIDTEQSQNHCMIVIHRIMKLAELPTNEDCDRLYFLALRKFNRFFVKFGGNLFFISMVFLFFFFLNPIKSCRYVCFLVTLKTPHH